MSSLYQLYRGGRSPGAFCKGVFERKPAHSQFDYRVDGKGSLETVTWQSLMNELSERYGVSPDGLVVGDKLAFALIPNFSTYESIGVHMSSLPAGFTFDIVSNNGIVLTSDKYEHDIDSTGAATSETKTAATTPTGLGSPLTTSKAAVFVFKDRAAYVGDCDELVIEIKGIPAVVDGGAGALSSVMMALRVDFENHFDSGRI